MNQITKLIILVSVGMSTACTPPTSQEPTNEPSNPPVVANGQERGGGDAGLIRSDLRDADLAQLIDKLEYAFTNPAFPSVRRMTTAFLSRVESLPTSASKTAILDMVSRDAIGTLWKTKFVISKECVDTFERKKRSATAIMNPRTADQFEICVDLDKIAHELGPQITDAELIGLTVHELAHFFGYLDSDRKIATTVAKFLIQEASAIGEESLFHLVPTENRPLIARLPKVEGVSPDAAALRKKIGDGATRADRLLFDRLWTNARAKGKTTANWLPELDDDLLRGTSVMLRTDSGSSVICHRAPPLTAYMDSLRSIVFPQQYIEAAEGAVISPAGIMAYRCEFEGTHEDVLDAVQKFDSQN